MTSGLPIPPPLVAIVVFVLFAAGCLPIADDPASRAQVVELARAGKLAAVNDDRRDTVFLLPRGLDHVSQGGEVHVEHDGDELVVVFFDFRGLNHYTGWVYTSTDKLEDDPLGETPFTSQRVAPNWFRVDAG
jgi:hypothetical protein